MKQLLITETVEYLVDIDGDVNEEEALEAWLSTKQTGFVAVVDRKTEFMINGVGEQDIVSPS